MNPSIQSDENLDVPKWLQFNFERIKKRVLKKVSLQKMIVEVEAARKPKKAMTLYAT